MPVPVVASPKFQRKVRGSLSASVEPVASKPHVMPEHEVVKLATGAVLVGGVTVPVPGLTTTENSWPPPPAVLLVAVRPAAVPVATGAPESASRELTLPPPVAASV